MINLRRLSLVFGLLFTCLLSTTAPLVLAQEESTTSAEKSLEPPAPTQAINMSVSPVRLIFDTEPNSTTKQNVKIRNNGIESEFLEAALMTFDMADGVPQLREFREGESFAEWISFSEETFQVKPGEWKTITVEFAPPENAALNYNYVLVFRRQRDVEANPGETAVIGAPAILTLANVKSENAVTELQLLEFSLPKVVFEYLPVEFTVKTKNTGNVFLAPFGNVFIDSNSQKDLAVLSLNPEGGYVLPDSEGSFTPLWDKGFPVYQAEEEDGRQVKNEDGEQVYKLNWNFSEADQFRIGKYTANLILVYDNGTQDVPIESQVSFWVIPWRLLAISSVIIILTLVGLRSTFMSIIHGIVGVFSKK